MFRKIFLICTILLPMVFVVSCTQDFLTGGKLENDPNQASIVDYRNVFTAVQVSQFVVMEGHLNRNTMMWMQQMAGVAQHYTGYDIYDVTGGQFEDQWLDIYGGGGLVDMEFVKTEAAKAGNRKIAGVMKIWEALIMSTTADLWGDIPYSEACDPDIDFPKYEKMSEVYAALHILLDEAIADLQSGEGTLLPQYDFVFGGELDKWIAAAHTLKARMYVNWAEVDAGNYALALAQAQQGIASTADNWKSLHSSTAGEEAIWYQFDNRRGRYMAAGKFLVELLKTRNDPRLQIYFGTDADGGYSGSSPGEKKEAASWLNTDTYGAIDWALDFVTWEEGQFIIAECQYAANNEAAAIATLDNIMAGLETKWGLDANALPRYAGAGLTGIPLLEAIMLEKYIALFLNMQIWSDWRRTAFPIFTDLVPGKNIPRRILYTPDEKSTNPNIANEGSLALWQRNENDPGNPSYPGYTVNP